MTTYPLATLACTVDENGITAPSFSDIVESLKATYRGIFGQDINLDDDTQDGQLIGAQAQAYNDFNNACIATYNQFSPATAVGAGLSSVIKINGIRRQEPSNSTCDVTIVGVDGTVITSGLVGDDLNRTWELPETVTVPGSGEVTVTATASVTGNLQANPGTLTRILTPTLGWQTVTNAAAATPGAPVELDAALRRRQSVSTALPAQSVLDAIIGAVGDVAGVVRFKGYENDTDAPDADGLPEHSIALVVQGGDATDIATTIMLKKTPGAYTYGTTVVPLADQKGVPITIRFFRLTEVAIKVEVTIAALGGYVSTTGDAAQLALLAYINGTGSLTAAELAVLRSSLGQASYESLPLEIGEDSYYVRLGGIAGLVGTTLGSTYVVTQVRQAVVGDPFLVQNLTILFNQGATLDADDITWIVV